jgi:hypothetical protein
LKHDRESGRFKKTERCKMSTALVLIFLADDPLLVFSNLKFVVSNNFAKPVNRLIFDKRNGRKSSMTDN